MRIALHTGKGGVGKTTLSVATAVAAAREGHRTLILSTDPAHSVADVLGAPVAADPTPDHVLHTGNGVGLDVAVHDKDGELQVFVHEGL